MRRRRRHRLLLLILLLGLLYLHRQEKPGGQGPTLTTQPEQREKTTTERQTQPKKLTVYTQNWLYAGARVTINHLSKKLTFDIPGPGIRITKDVPVDLDLRSFYYVDIRLADGRWLPILMARISALDNPGVETATFKLFVKDDELTPGVRVEEANVSFHFIPSWILREERANPCYRNYKSTACRLSQVISVAPGALEPFRWRRIPLYRGSFRLILFDPITARRI